MVFRQPLRHLAPRAVVCRCVPGAIRGCRLALLTPTLHELTDLKIGHYNRAGLKPAATHFAGAEAKSRFLAALGMTIYSYSAGPNHESFHCRDVGVPYVYEVAGDGSGAGHYPPDQSPT